MSKNNKILIAVCVVLIIIGLIILNVNKNKNKETTSTTNTETEATQSAVVEKKSNGTYEMFNSKLNAGAGKTEVITYVKNVSDVATPERFVDIILLDKDNNELGTMKANVPALQPGQTTQISAESTKVYENVYNFAIK